MNESVTEQVVTRLAPNGCMERSEAEAGYPPRPLADGELVMRIAPSPTGFVHIGTIYTALINERLAHQTNGLFLLRIEDTDKSREVAGGKLMIVNALDQFGLRVDEGPGIGGIYGPYTQSERQPLYMSYALDLLRRGLAYPCFATPDELQANAAAQKAAKQRPGYYGQYAVWRDKPEVEVAAALQSGQPFVLRFRSHGSHEKRLRIRDILKGDVELPENDLDVPLIKSDGLPTYHLAHVVDDHLMGTSIVLRGDEWLSSTPLHIELAQALQIKPFLYAHIAPISILDNGAKRKLSKRKDAEADVQHWLKAGYPVDAIEEYLLRLANSNFEDWRRQNPDEPKESFTLSLKKLAMSRAPLLDMKKLDDISRDVIAGMPQDQFEQQITQWVAANDFELSKAFNQDPAYTSRVLTIERVGTNRRKDVSKWSDAREMYAYFFDELYQPTLENAIVTELAGYDFVLRKTVADSFLQYLNLSDDQPAWLRKMRIAAESLNFATDMKAYKAHPEQYKGSLADYAKIIRVHLTGKNRTPDLYLIIQIMGIERVRRRLTL
jgi:glutamyl-tRNA synthetase